MRKGFTLIELLVVIAIIGVLIGLSIFGLQGSRESSRDAKRKADIELIRSGIEIYKSDCGNYPVATYTTNWPAQIVGDGSPSSCAVTNVYLTPPTDPISPTRYYRYTSDGTTYELCAATEQGSGSLTCGGSSDCGTTCNYKVVSP
ncbi:MAG: type II secretion system protein [Patescibacteria group bacterium]